MRRSTIAIMIAPILLSGCFFQTEPKGNEANTANSRSGAEMPISLSGNLNQTGTRTQSGEPAAMTEAETEATMKEIEALINEAVEASGSKKTLSGSSATDTEAPIIPGLE